MKNSSTDFLPVTIAIPVYNGGDYIEFALNSVLSQNILPSEIIILENNSTDNTLEIAQSFTGKIPEGVIYRVIQSPTTIPYSDNWNKCILSSNMPYVLLLHADDELKNDALQTLWEAILEDPETILAGSSGEIFINKDGKKIKDTTKGRSELFKAGEIIRFFKKQGLYIPCSSVLMRRDALLNDHLLFPSNKPAADELLWIRIVARYSVKIVAQSVTLRRIHAKNTEYIDHLTKKEWIFSSYYDFLELAGLTQSIKDRNFIKKHIKKKIGKALMGIATSMIKKYKNIRVSMYYICKSLKIRPIGLFSKGFLKAVLFNILVAIGIYNHVYRGYNNRKYL